MPFPDGRCVLLVSSQGIYLLTPEGCRRILPTGGGAAGDPLAHLAMEHGAVSRDGSLIAVGCQDSNHLIYNDRLELIGDIGNPSSCPHCAAFSADHSVILLNACHFYQGTTIGVPTRLLPGLTTRPYPADARTPVLEGSSRVYAAASRADEFIIGDATGYVRAFGLDGTPRWRQFIGSSIGDIDVAADGRVLAVSTAAGFVVTFLLDGKGQEPHQIGTGRHPETARWLFWRGEQKPLRW